MTALRVSIELRSPLSHGAFDSGDIGNAVAIRREPIVSIPGAPRVPVLSGNALRGVVRRTVMRDLLGREGVRDALGSSWDRAYAALANGGHLDGSESSVSPSKIRDLREGLPPLSVLGAALYSWMLPGRVSFGICWPVCAETLESGLAWRFDEDAPVVTAEELVHETSTVRHVDRTEQDPEVSGVTPMPLTVEVLGTGARLCSEIRFERAATEIERSCIAWALDRIDRLGAKSGAGLGRVDVTHDGDGRAYDDWLTEEGHNLAGRLVSLSDGFGKKRGKK